MGAPSLRPPGTTTVLAYLACFRGALAGVAGLAGVFAFLSGTSGAAALLGGIAAALIAFAVLSAPEAAGQALPSPTTPGASGPRPSSAASPLARALGALGHRLAARPRRLTSWTSRWQLPADVVAISLLAYALADAGRLIGLAYAVPVGVAAVQSRRAGLALAAASVVGFAVARALRLAALTPRPGSGTADGSLLDPLGAAAILGLALVGLALTLAAQGAAWRRALVEAAEETARWREQAGREEADAAERGQAYSRLERLLRSRLAPILQVAHQLRAPVAAIQSCLDVVLQGYVERSPEQQRRLLQSARDSASEMLALTSDVLRLGELREATLGPVLELVDVGEVAAHTADALRAEALLKSVSLTVSIAPDLPCIRAKRAHLEELFRNLLDNAIKYNVSDGRVWLRLWLAGGGLQGEVGDTGIGIRERDLPRVFEEFFRADNAKEVVTRGTGLGLPIVKQVVELYGGAIEVHSKLGEGTVFTFSLPTPADRPAATVMRQTDGRSEQDRQG